MHNAEPAARHRSQLRRRCQRRDDVQELVGAGEGAKITVKGPLAQFEALKRRLNDETLVFRHQETADIDLSVEFGDSILVTRMAAWADTVRKVLA